MVTNIEIRELSPWQFSFFINNYITKGAITMAKEETRKVDTGIIQRGKTYRFTAYLGYDVNGKQIRKTTTYTPPSDITQRKADKLAKEEYINFCNRCKGLASFNENMRFSDLVEEYLKVFAPNKLKPITAYTYKGQINNHFIKYFGVVNGRFCPQSVRSFCPVVAGFNAGTYKVPACVL